MRLLPCASVILLLGISSQSVRADLLVGDYHNQQILRFTDSGTLLGTFAQQHYHLGAGIPGAMSIDSGNRIYITNATTGDVHRFDRAGNSIGYFGSIAEGSSTGLGIDFDSSGNLWFRQGAHIFRLNPNGTKTADFDTGFDKLGDIAIDTQNTVYIPRDDSHYTDHASEGIYRMTSDGRLLGTFGSATAAASDCLDPESTAFDKDGNLCVLSGQRILRYNSAGSFLGAFAAGSAFATADPGQFMTLDPAGNFYTGSGSENGVFKFSSDGAFLGKIIQSGIGSVPGNFRGWGMTYVPPVPDPASGALIAGAGVFLKVVRRRRLSRRGPGRTR
jgi:hypothetical protein